MPYTTVQIDVDLSDFDDDDILEEFERRGLEVELPERGPISEEIREIIEKIWQRNRTGLSIDKEVSELCYAALGRIL